MAKLDPKRWGEKSTRDVNVSHSLEFMVLEAMGKIPRRGRLLRRCRSRSETEIREETEINFGLMA